MSKKTEVTVGRKTYALTPIQETALMNAEFRFQREGLYTKRLPRGRKRPYISTGYRTGIPASSRRGLVKMGLVAPESWNPAVTAQGRRVAQALWPLHYDETMEELIARLNADDAEQERERKRKARVAVRAFTGIKDAQGRSVAKRIRDEDVVSGEWHSSLKLDLDDLAAIGEQIIARRR